MESENRPTDPRIRGIFENREVLLEALDVNPVLLTELSGHGILDERTKQSITSEKKYGINERFIAWLETGTPQTIDIVLQKLRDDKQDHVANLIDGAEGEQPLSDKTKRRIRKLSGWLTNNMTTDHGLIDELLARRAISSRDSEDIKSKPTESARVMELIEVLLRRSDGTLKSFLEALVASNQDHIAQVVEKDEMIELCIRQTCKTVDANLPRLPKTDKDEELQRKIDSIRNHNFALAVVKNTTGVIIYVLCDDCNGRKLLEELFESNQHKAVLLEELVKLSASAAVARGSLESEVLRLIQDILPNVGHSGIVLQTVGNCEHKSELGRVSESGSSSFEVSSLETDSTMTPGQSCISPEQSYVLRYEEVVCDPECRRHIDDDESLRKRNASPRKVDLCKKESSAIKTECREFNDHAWGRTTMAVQEQSEDQMNLSADDGAKESSDPAIQELQLKLKLAGKQRDRETAEITRLRKSLRQTEEDRDELNQDLNEMLNLNTENKERVFIELKQRVREVEKVNEQLNKRLTEALYAQQQREEEDGGPTDGHLQHSRNLQSSSLPITANEIKNEAHNFFKWPELKEYIELATELYSRNLVCVFLMMLHRIKSPREAIVPMIVVYVLILQPLLLHLPVGIPDAISSFCFTNISALFCGSSVIIIVIAFIMDRQNPLSILPALCIIAYYYLTSSVPGVGVGRYCQEDKCVYLFCWEYLSDNMRINEAVEQVPAQNYNGAGGLFKSPAAFAVWNKYTSHRWDEQMLEYTQGGQFIREVYTKPLVGTHTFHFLTAFRLSTGSVSSGHCSLFYDDPMLTLCLLDANGNTVKSFGRGRASSKGVPMVLDADREGCIIIADHFSGKNMTLCSDEDQMKRFQDQIKKGNRPLEMCLESQQF